MSKGAIFTAALLATAWLTLVPMAFVTLYTVLELQSAARSAVGSSANLTQLQVISLAKALDQLRDVKPTSEELRESRNQQRINLMRARGKVRSAAIDILSSKGETGVTARCTAAREDLEACQIDREFAACTPDWIKISACYEDAVRIARLDPALAPDLKQLRADMMAAQDRGFDFNATGGAARQAIDHVKALKDDKLYPVAESYRQISLPFFPSVFAWPSGVTVACFTSLLAAIGAGVSALLGLLQRRARESVETRIIVRKLLLLPAVGALAGFMVYFVVATGTAFLVQPGDGGASEVVGNLSAPALASLGIFAGLASESALNWLKARATSVFKVEDGKGASDP